MEICKDNWCWSREKNVYCRVVKKLVSIALLVVFLFNVIGYKVFFYYLERAADARIQSRIETLSEADRALITVKIPIKLPYQTDWQNFERTDGEVTVKGTVYRYVKQKVYRDTLILLCINDLDKTRLVKGSSEYFEKVNDLSAENNKKPVFKQYQTDYYPETTKAGFQSYVYLITSFPAASGGSCSAGFTHKIKIPPRSVLTNS
jgi:hypothetical protein